MAKYHPGDYVKAEFKDEQTGESEWMWVVVDSCDDEERVLFGRLDNEPVVGQRAGRGHGPPPGRRACRELRQGG
jgi:hypothetical protein